MHMKMQRKSGVREVRKEENISERDEEILDKFYNNRIQTSIW